MKKSLSIFLIFLLTFFSIPFGGLTALAKENRSTVDPDKAFNIEYVIKKEDGETESVANSFFENSAILLKKDDQVYIQTTISSGDMIKEVSSKYGEYILVQENKDGSIVIQLQINADLSDLYLDLHVSVPKDAIPGFPGYDEEHKAILKFDKDSQEEIEINEHKIIVDSKEDSKQSLVDLDNGYYRVDASYVRSDNDDPSSMGRYMGDNVFIEVKDGKADVTITVNEHHTVTKLLVEGQKSTVAKLAGSKRYETFHVTNLESVLNAYVEYQAPYRNSIHYGNAKFRIVLDEESLVEAEAGEQPGYEVQETLIQLDDGYYEIDVSYLRTDNDNASSMGRYMGDQVFLEVKDGKVLPTITINDNETVTKLTVDNKDPIETVIDGNKRYETFELGDLLSIVNAYVEYEAPSNGSVHYGNADFRISFNDVGIKQVEASDKPGADVEETKEVEVELGKQTPIKGGEVLTISGDETTEIILPENISQNAQVKINSAKDSVQNEGNLEIAGEVYKFEFSNLGDNLDKFKLVMGYDHEKYDLEDFEIDIYYFDGKKWIKQNGTVAKGKVVAEVDHFSTYGVFAKKIEKSNVEKPKNGEEIDYIIMHENGKEESIANGFFEKPGFIFEKNGKTYAQLTITNSDMIKELSSQFGPAEIVQTNADNSIVVQFIINDDLSDTLIEMRVVVQGLYDTTHKAIFVVNKDRENPKENEKDEGNEGEGTNETDDDPLPEQEVPEQEVPKEEDLLKPDTAYEVGYVIKHEDGTKESVANDFFVKPALILEKDGIKYIQVTITNGEMVKGLSNQYGEALFVKENNDGSVVYQFRINNDLSNMLLEMKIVVPGLYAEDHKAILQFNKESLRETDVGEHLLVATGDKNNKNAPFIEGENPQKPNFGSGDNEEELNNGKQNELTDDDKPTNLKNPQTGDKTNILLYSLLLIGSIIPLSMNLRRRFV